MPKSNCLPESDYGPQECIEPVYITQLKYDYRCFFWYQIVLKHKYYLTFSVIPLTLKFHKAMASLLVWEYMLSIVCELHDDLIPKKAAVAVCELGYVSLTGCARSRGQ